jgi:hypothetical protein
MEAVGERIRLPSFPESVYLEIVMPVYRVEALTKFLIRTFYVVDAENPEAAEAKCKSGEVSYEDLDVDPQQIEWIETVSVEPE